MVLLTFVMLVIGMLGIYTQVYAIEVARLFAHQTGIAQTMISWHDAALSLVAGEHGARSAIADFPAAGGACSLTASLAPVVPNCTINSAPGPGVAIGGSSPVTVDGAGYTCTVTGVTDHYPHLGQIANLGTYKWNSIAFSNAAGQHLVITYVPPVATAPYLISTANNSPLSVTASDLMHEFVQAGVPLFTFGYVSAAGTITAGGLTYTLPPSVTVAGAAVPGSVAIISSPDRCAGC